MWTPRPVSPLRYAGSVATSVLPSPVAISAILPSWSTMPPMSCTSQCRIRTGPRRLRGRGSARITEQLARVAARGVRDPLAAQHPRDLLDARRAREEVGGDARAAPPHALRDLHVTMGTRGDGRQVGHAEHLPA